MLTPPIAVGLDSTTFAEAARADPAAWLRTVTALEEAGATLVTVSDDHRGTGAARLDALMLTAWLAARTREIGLVPAAGTTVAEPFLLATQIATADFVSHGRAGWQLQVSGDPADRGFVGPREVAVGAAAWAEAAEFVTVVRALWDSWEDDAEIRDTERQRFIDRERIHHIDFAGQHFSVKGPSITPRSPQGQPPVAIALGPDSPAEAVALALAQADLILAAPGLGPGALRARSTSVSGPGREIRILADLPGDGTDVAAVGRALADGADGVRLILSAIEDLPGVIALVQALGPVRAERGAAPEVTLRARLGLSRPENRWSEALAARA